MRLSSLRVAMLVAALVVACSSDEDEDDGCRFGKACATNDDCKDYKPADFAILGPSLDARCFRKECVKERCEATPIPGGVEDGTDGDCARETCNDEGRIERVPDTSDAPAREGLEPCRRFVCETGFFGGLGPIERDLPEGASCFLPGGESGACIAGRCVPDGEADASTDDASSDAEVDAPADGATDAPGDAAAD